jgi:hypothetical protein
LLKALPEQLCLLLVVRLPLLPVVVLVPVLVILVVLPLLKPVILLVMNLEVAMRKLVLAKQNHLVQFALFAEAKMLTQ